MSLEKIDAFFNSLHDNYEKHNRNFMENWLIKHKGKVPKRFINPDAFAPNPAITPDSIKFIILSSITYGWVYGGVAVDVDPEVFDMMLNTPSSSIVPEQWIEALPGWTTYFIAPEGHLDLYGRPCTGYIVSRRIISGIDALYITPVFHDTFGNEIRLVLTPEVNGFQRINNFWKGATEEEVLAIERLVNTLLFLCTLIPYKPAAPKIVKRTTRSKRVVYDITPRKVKPIIDLTDSMDNYLAEQGTSITEVKQTVRRAHMRRAHWRSYWTGPRSDEQVKVLRWIPPTFVKGFVTE